MLSYSLGGIAILAFLTGVFILVFGIPARAKVITDGRVGAKRDARASVIVNGVYTSDSRYSPERVDHVLQFLTVDGEERRTEVRRSKYRDPPYLIWYSRKNPSHATARSPLNCFGLACICAITALWLRW